SDAAIPGHVSTATSSHFLLLTPSHHNPMFTVQFFIDCRNILIILLITICICNSVMARRGKRGH
ncbi:hypothetical protein D3C95_17550, partial [Escherichia coli]